MLFTGLWLSSTLSSGLTDLRFIFYNDMRIPVDILGHFNKIVEQYNKLKQAENFFCKNVFLLLLHKFFKRCIYTFSVVSFLYGLIFHKRWAKAKVIFRKKSWVHNCYLKSGFVEVSFWLDISWKLIRWNAWDQFQAGKFKFVGSRPVTCY